MLRLQELRGGLQAGAQARPRPIPEQGRLAGGRLHGRARFPHAHLPALRAARLPAACPVHPKAITKDPDTGVVEVHESLCTGCGECVMACPYSAMGYDAQGHHSVKCDLCPDRREKGLEPACAEICPGFAISFGERGEPSRKSASRGSPSSGSRSFPPEAPDDISRKKSRRENGRLNGADGLVSHEKPSRPRFVDSPEANGVFRGERPRLPLPA